METLFHLGSYKTVYFGSENEWVALLQLKQHPLLDHCWITWNSLPQYVIMARSVGSFLLLLFYFVAKPGFCIKRLLVTSAVM